MTMVEFYKKKLKDLGRQEEVFEALPYAVVGGAWEGSFNNPIAAGAYQTVMNYVVPAGHQLKILFLRICTQEATGARFRIYATAQTGDVGSVPYGVRDYPMLEQPGAEVLHGSLVDPIHVLEGSITFDVLGATPAPATGARYNFVWWGTIKIPEE